jgi:DNA-directed RNA polymerase specialized sigma24 family protein
LVSQGELSSDDGIFGALYPSLRRFAAVVAPVEMDPDDLLQEAVTRTIAIRSLSELENPGAYLRAAMVRLAANERRSLSRRRRAYTRSVQSDATRVGYPSDLDDLQRLHPRDRAVLYLSVVEGLPYREIAALVGCTEEAARARAARSLRRLRAEVGEELDDA